MLVLLVRILYLEGYLLSVLLFFLLASLCPTADSLSPCHEGRVGRATGCPRLKSYQLVTSKKREILSHCLSISVMEALGWSGMLYLWLRGVWCAVTCQHPSPSEPQGLPSKESSEVLLKPCGKGCAADKNNSCTIKTTCNLWFRFLCPVQKFAFLEWISERLE